MSTEVTVSRQLLTRQLMSAVRDLHHAAVLLTCIPADNDSNDVFEYRIVALERLANRFDEAAEALKVVAEANTLQLLAMMDTGSKAS